VTATDEIRLSGVGASMPELLRSANGRVELVVGGGAIKLETGEIHMRFKTVKRTGVGLSLLGVADRFIVVDGAAAWATAGLSLVAEQIIQRLTASGSSCEMVLRRDASDPQP